VSYRTFYGSPATRYLHPFPTRRSSDLLRKQILNLKLRHSATAEQLPSHRSEYTLPCTPLQPELYFHRAVKSVYLPGLFVPDIRTASWKLRSVCFLKGYAVSI